ncbi:MAG: amidohydrolase family protein, partial [Bacillota bacterium]
MRILSFSFSLVCAALVGAPLVHADSAAAPQVTVLKAAHIFDSVTGKLADHGVVVVTGDTITAVGADAPIPAGAKVIDLGDATLMPGMIDSHVHLDGQFEENWYKGFYQDQTRSPAE